MNLDVRKLVLALGDLSALRALRKQGIRILHIKVRGETAS